MDKLDDRQDEIDASRPGDSRQKRRRPKPTLAKSPKKMAAGSATPTLSAAAPKAHG